MYIFFFVCPLLSAFWLIDAADRLLANWLPASRCWRRPLTTLLSTSRILSASPLFRLNLLLFRYNTISYYVHELHALKRRMSNMQFIDIHHSLYNIMSNKCPDWIGRISVHMVDGSELGLRDVGSIKLIRCLFILLSLVRLFAIFSKKSRFVDFYIWCDLMEYFLITWENRCA